MHKKRIELICTPNKYIPYNKARKYLDSFFDAMSLLYGNISISINVHNLIHIIDDVEFFNCALITISYISAFPYESMLDKIRKIIRTVNHPLS